MNKQDYKRAVKGDKNLIYADLRYSDLRGVDLSNTNLTRANLYKANLIGTNLMGANLENANLIDALLRDTNLRYTNLEGTSLNNVNLKDADLINIKNCKNVIGKTILSITLEMYEKKLIRYFVNDNVIVLDYLQLTLEELAKRAKKENEKDIYKKIVGLLESKK